MSTNPRQPRVGHEQQASSARGAMVHTPVVSTPGLSIGRQTWNFVRHYLEMCAAMCIGGSVLRALVLSGASWAGHDRRDEYPEISLLVIAALYVAPMTVWMRFRRMGWRPNLEMSGAAIGLAVAVIGLTWLGAVPESSLATWQAIFCGPACIVMFVVMLFRLDLYSGRTGHHT
jgi:hypothetical protein